MDKGAAGTYETIDTTVTANLLAAREVLYKIKLEGDNRPPQKTTNHVAVDSQSVNITDYSISRQAQQTDASSICLKREKKEKESVPPILVRCPEKQKENEESLKKGHCTRAKKSEKFQFPEAHLLTKNPKRFSSLEPLESVENLRQSTPRSETPDTLFPPAHYKPRCFKKKEVENGKVMARSPLSPGLAITKTETIVTKTSTTTKANIIHRRERGNSDLSKSSSSESSESANTDESLSMSQLPMTFFSKDGKMKMKLTKMEDGNVGATVGKIAKTEKKGVEKKKQQEKQKKNAAEKLESEGEEPFPPVPKQLFSSQDVRTHRNKFNANFKIGPHSVDISGLFRNHDLKKQNVEKLLINGKSYIVK